MFIKMLEQFSAFSVSGFIMVSSKSFVLSEMFELKEVSFCSYFFVFTGDFYMLD